MPQAVAFRILLGVGDTQSPRPELLAVAKGVQFGDPPRRQLGAVSRHDLVRPGVGPGAPIPPAPQRRTGLGVRIGGAPHGLITVEVASDLRRAGAERTDELGQFDDLTGARVEGDPCVASACRNPGSVMTAACPIPLIAAIESRTATVSRPRQRPAANTRAFT